MSIPRHQARPDSSIDPFPCGLIETTADGEIIRSNRMFGEWTGVTPSEIVGHSIGEFLHVRAADGSQSLSLPQMTFVTSARHEDVPVIVESEVGHDGHQYLAVVNAASQVDFAISLQGRHALAQRTQERLELVIAASIAFAGAETESELANVLTDTAARAFSAEHAVVYLEDGTGSYRTAAGDSPFSDGQDPDLLAAVPDILRRVVKVAGVEDARTLSPALGRSFAHRGVYAMISAPLRQSGAHLGALAVFFEHPRQFDEQASPLADALAGQATRAIANLRLRAELHHAAVHDGVTGLPNRRHLEEHLESLIPHDRQATAIVFVDLDGFKSINDQLGHLAGDDLLREVGRRLLGAVREDDHVARFGGDEFVVVCEVKDQQSAIDVAERIRDEVERPYGGIPRTLQPTASVGLVISDSRTDGEVDHMLRAADQAMYEAKLAGGNQVVVGEIPLNKR